MFSVLLPADKNLKPPRKQKRIGSFQPQDISEPSLWWPLRFCKKLIKILNKSRVSKKDSFYKCVTVVDLYDCASFRCTAKEPSHTHTYPFPFYLPSWSIPRDWTQLPVLCSRTSLFVHSKWNNAHLLTPNPQSIPLPPPSPLATASLLSMSVSLSLLCRWVHLCHILFLVFLGPHPRHMEVPRLGVKLELQLPAYTTATATWDLSHVCDLHHTSQQCQILNPLSEVRDQTHVLMDTSRVHYH